MEDPNVTSIEGYVSTGDLPFERVEMQFQDGVHVIHEAIVQHLGGAEVLRKNTTMFHNKTYQEFVEGFFKLVEQDRVRKALGNVIQSHLMTHGQIL